MELLPRYTAVLAGKKGTLDVLVRISAKDATGPRAKLDLAMVLDRSGSMRGGKLLSVKQAALETLRSLDPDDRITLVSYETSVHLEAERVKPKSEQGRKLEAKILALESTGGTALGPALQKGLRVLGKGKREVGVVGHLVLLSDGMANEGESRPEVLAQWDADAFKSGTAVSTLGVGLDYNEDLMTKIADAGGGRYHFIEADRQVAEVVAQELAALTATVADKVVLTTVAAPAVTVGDITGYATEADGNGRSARVGSLAAGRKRELVVRLAYDAPSPRRNTLGMGTFTLRFRDTTADGAEREIEMPLSVDVTESPKLVEASEDVAVTVRAVELEVATTMVEATRAVDEMRFDDARRQLRTTREKLEKLGPRPEYEQMIVELREAEAGIGEAEQNAEDRKFYGKSYKAKAYQKQKK